MINLKKFDKKKLLKSKTNIAILILAGTLVICSIMYLGVDKSDDKKVKSKKGDDKEIVIKTTKEVLTAEELWKNAIETKLKEHAQLQEKLINGQIEKLKETIEANKQPKDPFIEDKLSNLSKEVDDIKKNGNNLKIKESPVAKNNGISQFHLNLENAHDSKDYKTLKTADNYIPAGSFARAVLLSGIDAETGLNASSEPEPILIRIVEHGTLPRKFQSDLKDCHIIGAAYGNLSSERVKIRLEKLSCTEITTAEIVETEVAGYVSGEDGRAGLRGQVVSTEGRLLGNSMIAGVLGGLSNNFNPSASNQPTAILTDKLENINNKQNYKEKFKDSIASGATSSLDRLSKYYIDRAESLQPVVEIGAGREVDVIFTEGVFFGNSELKKAIAKKRDEQIKNKSGNVNTSVIRQLGN